MCDEQRLKVCGLKARVQKDGKFDLFTVLNDTTLSENWIVFSFTEIDSLERKEITMPAEDWEVFAEDIRTMLRQFREDGGMV